MKSKKLADWILNSKRYEIIERPHTIFQTEVIIREHASKKKNIGKGDE